MQETQEIWVQSLGCKYPLEKEMAIHSNILAWKIPWTEEPGGLRSLRFKELDATERNTQLLGPDRAHMASVYLPVALSAFSLPLFWNPGLNLQHLSSGSFPGDSVLHIHTHHLHLPPWPQRNLTKMQLWPPPSIALNPSMNPHCLW